MSSSANPFGLRPAMRLGGNTATQPMQYSIANGYNTNLLQGAPVKIGTDGNIQLAAAGQRACGVFQGVQYTGPTGRPVYDNKWIANTVATDAIAFVTVDADLLYEIQANATMTIANIGEQYDWTTATAGSTTTGLSSVALDVASTAANAGLQVVDLVPGPDNAWGDSFPIVLVRISEHQMRADVAAF